MPRAVSLHVPVRQFADPLNRGNRQRDDEFRFAMQVGCRRSCLLVACRQEVPVVPVVRVADFAGIGKGVGQRAELLRASADKRMPVAKVYDVILADPHVFLRE